MPFHGCAFNSWCMLTWHWGGRGGGGRGSRPSLRAVFSTRQAISPLLATSNLPMAGGDSTGGAPCAWPSSTVLLKAPSGTADLSVNASPLNALRCDEFSWSLWTARYIDVRAMKVLLHPQVNAAMFREKSFSRHSKPRCVLTRLPRAVLNFTYDTHGVQGCRK